MRLFKQFKKKKITFFHQLTSTDCGAACLCMVASYFKKPYSLYQVKSLFEFTRSGVSIQDIVDNSKAIGFDSKVLKITSSELATFPFPVILYWKQNHFVVFENVVEKNKKITFNLADPAYGRVKLDKDTFEKEWKGNIEKGVVIVNQPNDSFSDILPHKDSYSLFKSPLFLEVRTFIKRNRFKYILSIFLILIGLLANWSIPFVFQKVIDEGIGNRKINLVFYFLIAQLVLFLSYFVSDFFSRLILTKFNFILSVDLKENLLKKLIKLPINFFDTRLNTETLQRLNDQKKIQNFVTWKGIDLVLNVLNIIVFGSILFYYNIIIFSTYFFLTVLSVLWVLLFLKKRSILEYAMFLKQSENNNIIYEFIMNVPEIKINGAQNKTINRISLLQKGLNKLELRSLFLNTYQIVGVNFLSKIKEIVAIAICAFFIINEEMTLGILLSISYIIGQLVNPTNSLVDFIRDTQDTKIANERIGEIHNTKNEDLLKNKHVKDLPISSIYVEKLKFKYPGKFSPYVLKNINFSIKKNTVTAVVGASGSGKTTLLKLLLSYYKIEEGKILLNGHNIDNVFSDEWRNKCGIVMQDGKIFSGTIAENIVLSEEFVDFAKLEKACKIAQIFNYVKELPMGFDTKIGNIGIQLSGGQEQRILIARAVYKDPQFLFLDEATSALDAENEKVIHDNLQVFFRNKTVLIIAHRLSTVKNADQIIVLREGGIVEIGTHQELVLRKSYYYNLVKNQLELGK